MRFLTHTCAATLALALLAAPTLPGAEVQTYLIETDASSLNFVGHKASRQHDGGFHQFSGTLVVTDGVLSSVDVEIDLNSIWTDTERLTGHLKTPDFFNVEVHPTAHFVSDTVAASGEQVVVSGTLDLHGVESHLSFPVSTEMTAGGIHAASQFTLMRFDWGINYPGNPDDSITPAVDVSFDVATRPQE
jgi:polyisoprenoid-binding protein YceI